jgi:hypothetical protein
MTISEVKNIPIADYLQSIGITPCKRQGNNLWYYSPFRQETEPSFKVNLARNEYLQSRNIHIPFAQQFCKEVHYLLKDKPYFTIGFQNDWGGYELRNGSDTCCVFEGFMDYLSYLTLLHRRNPEVSINKRDYVILNSVSNVSKAIGIVSDYQAKFCYLDNDKSGVSAFQEIQKHYGANVFDKAMYYREYKDLNDYLTDKKQVVEKQKKRGLKM